jgi:hypothetical protein
MHSRFTSQTQRATVIQVSSLYIPVLYSYIGIKLGIWHWYVYYWYVYWYGRLRQYQPNTSIRLVWTWDNVSQNEIRLFWNRLWLNRDVTSNLCCTKQNLYKLFFVNCVVWDFYLEIMAMKWGHGSSSWSCMHNNTVHSTHPIEKSSKEIKFCYEYKFGNALILACHVHTNAVVLGDSNQLNAIFSTHTFYI